MVTNYKGAIKEKINRILNKEVAFMLVHSDNEYYEVTKVLKKENINYDFCVLSHGVIKIDLLWSGS